MRLYATDVHIKSGSLHIDKTTTVSGRLDDPDLYIADNEGCFLLKFASGAQRAEFARKLATACGLTTKEGE